jgi:hypothetical protein
MKRKQLSAGVPAIFLIIVLVTWFAGTLLTAPSSGRSEISPRIWSVDPLIFRVNRDR